MLVYALLSHDLSLQIESRDLFVIFLVDVDLLQVPNVLLQVHKLLLQEEDLAFIFFGLRQLLYLFIGLQRLLVDSAHLKFHLLNLGNMVALFEFLFELLLLEYFFFD